MTALDTLALLRATVDPRWVALLTGPDLSIEVRLPLPDGEEVTYRLRIDTIGPAPRVREEGTSLVPDCAARHLFADRTFCMGYGHDGPPVVLDRASAVRWWAVLRGYLELQVLADLTGEWDPRYERAHGNGAVAVEEILDHAAVLFPGLVDAVRRGAIRRTSTPGRVTPRRSPCPCGSGKQLRDCHEELTVALLAALADQARLEKAAWAAAGRACCGRMRRCPLRTDESPSQEHA